MSRSLRFLALPVLLGWLLALPAFAAGMQVLAVRYDEGSQTLIMDTTGEPRVNVKRLHSPDRLVVDVLDAGLKQVPVTVTQPGRKIRGFRTGSVTAPEGTRIVVELQPGIEPLVAIRQAPGRVALSLNDAPLPRGERDLETLPPPDLLSEFVLPEPTPAPTVAPTPRPLPVIEVPVVAPVATLEPTPLAGEPPWPVVEQPRVVRDDLRGRPDFGSTVTLRWAQLETLEDYRLGSGPIFAYPAGINGLEWRHWWGTYLGMGLDGRMLSYDEATAGTRQNRSEIALLPTLAVRLPLAGGALEPELHVGYMGRHITVYSLQLGAGPAFAPTQFHYGPAVGGALRARLLPALSFHARVQYLPTIGGNLYGNFKDQSFGSIFFLSQLRYMAEFQVDMGPAYWSLGYQSELTSSTRAQYSATFAGLRVGFGWRY